MCWRPTKCGSRQTATRRLCCSPTAIRPSGARATAASATMPCGVTRIPSRATCLRWWAAILPRLLPTSRRHRAGRSTCASTWSRARRTAAPGPWIASSAPCAGTRSASGANTTSTCSTSLPSPTSTWARWRTRGSTSSTMASCSRRPRRPRTARSSGSSASLRTSIFTTGRETASPAATGSSCA